MKVLLIYVLLASVSLYSCSSCKLHSGSQTIVDAGAYELKFDEIFQKYWQNNRTITDELRNIVETPKQPNLRLEGLPNCKSPKNCLICRAFSFSLLNYYRNHFEQDLDEYLYDLCTILAETVGYQARGLINIYVIIMFAVRNFMPCLTGSSQPSIKYILKHRANELTSERICGILLQQNECTTLENLIDFTIQPAHEPVLKASKKYNFHESAMNSSWFLTIAHLSDFHYDPYYAAGSSSQCKEGICCRTESTAKENSTLRAGYWGDYGVCDSPGYLVENICSEVAAKHKNIDLIYYTGDFTDHFNWATTKSSVKHSIEFITQQIKEKFPNIPVAMVIGNHDLHPSDAFAPKATGDELNSKWLYEFAADLWSDWLDQSALATLRHGGYYTFLLRPKFRIIVLNNNLCFTHNIWLLYGADEMIAHLEWLRDTLVLAEMAGEKVHILGHIPPKTATCIRAWNREYDSLVRQFAHIISGHFTGHTHSDEFVLLYSEDDVPVPLNIAWGGGSGTSFVGLNSNYRLYTVESDTLEVVDHETYIFNLTEANLAPAGQPPKWFKEYSFREAFGVNDLSPFSLSKLVNSTFRHDRRLLHKYCSYKYNSADAAVEKECDTDEKLEEMRLVANGELEYNWFE